ncbi:hypothetical protein BPC006_II2923 [Burkholderia pseudomallei BPC006]|nr:hypothetical protein BPC006_II2923 [Burkholderia pseudomallei BPC006]
MMRAARGLAPGAPPAAPSRRTRLRAGERTPPAKRRPHAAVAFAPTGIRAG